jgi:hypothetical protein
MVLKKIVNGEEVLVSPAEQQELEERWAAADAERKLYLSTRKYRKDRREDYPDIGDQLDAILKHLNYMQLNGETNLIAELDDIIGKWLAVKAKHPKPEDPK